MIRPAVKESKMATLAPGSGIGGSDHPERGDHLMPLPMSQPDYQLSMAISRRARHDEDNDGLRSLLIHRLSDTIKAVWRQSLRTDKCSVYCEGCHHWTVVDEAPDEFRCGNCGRMYALEFAIYEEVEE